MKIALSIVAALFMIGCSQDATQKEEVVDTKQVEAVQEKTAMEKVTDKVAEAKEEIKSTATEVTQEVKQEVLESAQVAVEKVQDAVEAVKEQVDEAAVAEIDADLLYNKCASCHGGMADRSALNKSAVIRDWSAKQIESALLGYKNGTYGRTMKAMMQSQVRTLSDAEIKALSIYISNK
jgi:cytochrome c553